MNERENLRYNEIKHEDIKSIDDINKIVENESKLEQEREAYLKKGMKTANRYSNFMKIIIAILILIIVVIIIFLAFPIIKELINKYEDYGTIPNEFILSEYLKEKHGMTENDFDIQFPEVLGKNNSGIYILTPKWNSDFKFELEVQSTYQFRNETPDYKSSIFEYLKDKYNEERKSNNKPEFIMYKEVKNIESEKEAKNEIERFAIEIYDFFYYIKTQKEVPFNNKYKFCPSIKLIMKDTSKLYEVNTNVSTETTFEELKNEMIKKYYDLKEIK